MNSIVSGVAGAPHGTPRQSWNSGGWAMCPSSIMRRASMTWPGSKTSSSGLTPASETAFAMIRRCDGMLTNPVSPKFIDPTSRLQISGRNSTTCCTRASGAVMVVPGPPTRGSLSLGTNREPGPVVRFSTMSAPDARIRSTTARYSASSWLGPPVLGSRTWMCAIAAPARAASITESAICAGVTGTPGCLPTVSPPPVTAQLTITFLDIGACPLTLFSNPARRARSGC